MSIKLMKPPKLEPESARLRVNGVASRLVLWEPEEWEKIPLDDRPTDVTELRGHRIAVRSGH